MRENFKIVQAIDRIVGVTCTYYNLAAPHSTSYRRCFPLNSRSDNEILRAKRAHKIGDDDVSRFLSKSTEICRPE